jgi:hypothetical protein
MVGVGHGVVPCEKNVTAKGGKWFKAANGLLCSRGGDAVAVGGIHALTGAATPDWNSLRLN